jgi:hypothetical protein
MKGMRMSANTAPELLSIAAMSIPDAGTVAVQDRSYCICHGASH